MRYYCIPLPVVLFCVFILSNGCENETIVVKEVEKVHAWKIVTGFDRDNKLQLNSFGDSANLYTINHSMFTISHRSTSTDRLIVEPYWLSVEASLYKRFPICSRYFAVAENSTVRINIANDPLGYYADKWLYMKQIDPNFIEFDFPAPRRSDAIAINGSNSILIPYVRSDTVYMKTAAMLVTFSIDDYYTSKKLDTISTKVIQLGYDDSPFGIYHFDDHYFFAGRQTYRIPSNGNATVCYPGAIYNLFSTGTDLFAMSFGDMLRSKDKGTSWQKIGSIPYIFESMHYKNIDGAIIAHQGNQIFRITLNDSVNTIEELENDGLEGNLITSVSRYKDNFYITTYAGVFSRPANTFFTVKNSAVRKGSFFGQ